MLLDNAGSMLADPTGVSTGLAGIVLSVFAVEAAVNDFLELVANVPRERAVTLDDRVWALWEIVAATDLAERTDRTPLVKRIRILSRALIQVEDVFSDQPFADLKLAIDWRNLIAHSRPERLLWDGARQRYRSEITLRDRTYKALGIDPAPDDVVSSFHNLLATVEAGGFAHRAAVETVGTITRWFPERYVVTTGYVSLYEPSTVSDGSTTASSRAMAFD